MGKIVELLRRAPFAAALAAAILALSVVTGTLWSALAGRTLRDVVAYGLPPLEGGRWWTAITGTVFALTPAGYLAAVVAVLALVGAAELRLGTRRTVIAFVGCQVGAILVTAVLLLVLRGHGWDWATELASSTDAGPAAGALGAAAAATATLSAPWRGRLRVLLASYVLVRLLYVGALDDLQNAIATGIGLAAGPPLLGRRPGLSVHPLTRRDYRLLASGFFIGAAIVTMISAFAPLSGPFASTAQGELRAEMLTQDRSDAVLGAAIQALIWLVIARGLYRGRRRAWRWSVAVMVLSVLASAAAVASTLFDAPIGWPLVTYGFVLNAVGLILLLVGRRAFRNPSRRRARRTTGNLLASASEHQRAAAVEQLRREGTVNNLAWMTTWPENRWFAAADTGYVAYRVHAGVALGLCDPVADSAQDRARLLDDFAEAAHAQGLLPCLFSVTAEASRHARALGWQALEVAEEAVIDLPGLEFKGKAWQDVRTALNQAAKRGITHRLGPLAQQPRGIQVQVRAISQGWVEDKGLPEMGFTLGGVDEALDPDVRVGLAVDADVTIHGITSWMPVFPSGGGEPVGWTLDVMRRLPGGFRYSMEFLIASACLAFQAEGCRFVSLSGAPLARAGAEDSTDDRGPLDTFLDTLGETLEPYYGFRSLQAFKSKFQPHFDPLYLVFPDEAALPRIGVALSRAYLPEAGLRDFVALARAGR